LLQHRPRCDQDYRGADRHALRTIVIAAGDTRSVRIRCVSGSIDRLRATRLYLVLEASVRGGAAAEIVAPAIEGGVDIVQLRDKTAGDDEIVTAGREPRARCEGRGALFVVHGRPDLALACGTHGDPDGPDGQETEGVRRAV